MTDLHTRLTAILGPRVQRLRPLGSGATGSVLLVELSDGKAVVAKTSDSAQGDGLQTEARTLELLAARSSLPVPRVLHAARDLLVMEYKPGYLVSAGSGLRANGNRDKEDVLAEVVRRFRSLRTAASLKHVRKCEASRLMREFPQSQDCGLIEASACR